MDRGSWVEECEKIRIDGKIDMTWSPRNRVPLVIICYSRGCFMRDVVGLNIGQQEDEGDRMEART